MKKLINGIILILSVLYSVSIVNAGTDKVLSKDGKAPGTKSDLQANTINVTEERNSEKTSIDINNEEKESIYLDINDEDLIAEIDLFSELDFQILDELFPEHTKLLVK
jgi:hypothetical protein